MSFRGGIFGKGRAMSLTVFDVHKLLFVSLYIWCYFDVVVEIYLRLRQKNPFQTDENKLLPTEVWAVNAESHFCDSLTQLYTVYGSFVKSIWGCSLEETVQHDKSIEFVPRGLPNWRCLSIFRTSVCPVSAAEKRSNSNHDLWYTFLRTSAPFPKLQQQQKLLANRC